MSHLTLLLPFALPPPEIAGDLLKSLDAPGLAMLLSRSVAPADAPRTESLDEFSRALPHETWLARAFGLTEHLRSENSPPIAAPLMQSYGLDSRDNGTWFVLQPVHIHIARDHLVLTDPRRLAVTDDEAHALFEIASSLFAEYGKSLMFGDAGTWFLRADDWSALETATPDAASGHNIDIWMARGKGDRDWRKLQNEVQMHWFDHPANQSREARGQPTVNSIWIWGGSPSSLHVAAQRYTEGFNLSGWERAFIPRLQRHRRAEMALDVLSSPPQSGLALLDRLCGFALANDWSGWPAEMQSLESHWFEPLLDALRAGRLSRLSLVATSDSRIARFDVTRFSLRKFWVRPSLAPLLT